eukprot:1461786-Pleurochrysis_carterae.AAC.1
MNKAQGKGVNERMHSGSAIVREPGASNCKGAGVRAPFWFSNCKNIQDAFGFSRARRHGRGKER